MVHGKDITFSYQTNSARPIISHADFDVEAGEFVVILGANGSGKSTFCRLINGLLPLQSGQLTAAGIDVADADLLWELRRRVGMVFQNPDNQFVSSVVAEDIAFGPENYEFPRAEIEKRIAYALEFVDMQGFENACPHLLSGGQKQRIALAGVLALNPDIIILDEATAMLDSAGKKEILDKIHKLKKFHKTIIMVTHYIEEAAMADKIYVLNQGTFTACGTPKEILTDTRLLIQSGLLPSMTVQLYSDLNKLGIHLKSCPVTMDALVGELCQFKQKI